MRDTNTTRTVARPSRDGSATVAEQSQDRRVLKRAREEQSRVREHLTPYRTITYRGHARTHRTEWGLG